MTQAFHCDNCKELFKGKPALELSASIGRKSKLEKKAESDGEDGDYCEACGLKIFRSIIWGADE